MSAIKSVFFVLYTHKTEIFNITDCQITNLLGNGISEKWLNVWHIWLFVHVYLFTHVLNPCRKGSKTDSAFTSHWNCLNYELNKFSRIFRDFHINKSTNHWNRETVFAKFIKHFTEKFVQKCRQIKCNMHTKPSIEINFEWQPPIPTSKINNFLPPSRFDSI